MKAVFTNIVNKFLLPTLLLTITLTLAACSDNPTSERIVMRNLRREFPDGNFQLEGLTSRRVPAFPYFHFDFQRNAYDVHVVRCLDYDITFTTLDGRNSSYLQRLLSSHLLNWNEQLTSVFEDAHPNTYNTRVNISLHTSLSERSVHNSHTALNVIPDAHLWLRDVASFEEGFATVASYEGVGGVFFNISHDIILNEINIDEEISNIKTLAQNFVLPFHNLVALDDIRVVTRLHINFLKDNHDVRLGRFEWVHDSIADDALANIASFNLSNYLTISTIYDELSLLETVSFEGFEIIGAWGRRSHPSRQYFFNEDGTGRITYDGGREFIWRILEDDYLLIVFENDILWTQDRNDDIHITYDPRSRIMPYAIDGNAFAIQAAIGSGRNAYIRVEWPPQLHGTWAWEIDPDWVTVMDADGTGHRGFPDELVNFRWLVETEDRQLHKFREGYGSNGRERWSYEFDGDTLVLINWYIENGQERGQRFRYTPIE